MRKKRQTRTKGKVFALQTLTVIPHNLQVDTSKGLEWFIVRLVTFKFTIYFVSENLLVHDNDLI